MPGRRTIKYEAARQKHRIGSASDNKSYISGEENL